MRRSDSLLAQMSSDPWFGALPAVLRKAILARSQPVSLSCGEYLFHRGEAPTGVHAVVTGRLKAATVRPDGREAILSILEPGSWFGEASVINGNGRVHGVQALEPCKVLTLRKPAFEELMEENAFAQAICRLLSRRTHVLYKMIEDATLHSIRVRIAHRLLRWPRTDAVAGSGKWEVRVSRDTLAMMLGISRQTLALELKVLADAGAVALHYGRIEILSPRILESD